MTCRIERLVVGESSVVLRVSGRIERENVGTLQELIEQTSGEVSLDLKEITLVDRHTVMLLALYERSGVELKNLPTYLREWVSKEQAQIKEAQR